MEKKSLNLEFIWKVRLKLWAEGDKLCAEGCKLRAEGCKLWAEGDKLRAEGDKLWADVILEVYGNIEVEWKGKNCYLETGEVFKEETD